jgi:hypothetical protein
MLSAQRLQRLAALRHRRPRCGGGAAATPTAAAAVAASRCRSCGARARHPTTGAAAALRAAAGDAAGPVAAAATAADPIEWPGLSAWRAAGVDDRRGWGARGAAADVSAPGDAAAAALPLAPSLVECALQVLQTADPTIKAGLAHRAWQAYCEGGLPLGADGRAGAPLPVPGRPARPERPRLVAPKQVGARPGAGSGSGRVCGLT